ncbi:MAG: CRISPR-associated ring nuclease Crn3/Csx3 [Thermofilum sp.]
MKVSFKVIQREEYTVVHFDLEGVLEPRDLQSVKPPAVNLAKGVVLSGRGPIWLYGFLVHHYHPAKFVAVYDPRIGAVVVETHTPEREVGEVIEVGTLP